MKTPENEPVTPYEQTCIDYVRVIAQGICRRAVQVERVRPLGSRVCRAVLVPAESDTRHLIGRSGRVFKSIKALACHLARVTPSPNGIAFWLETVRAPAVRDEGLRIIEDLVPGSLKSDAAVIHRVKQVVEPICGPVEVRVVSPSTGEFYIVILNGKRPETGELEEAIRVIIGALGVNLGAVLRAEWA